MSNENKREILTKNINNWKAKLLDLSMKNKALNFNVSPAKTIVPKIKIVSPVLDDFIKIINSSSKEEFEINSYKMSSLYARDQYGQTKTFYSHTINDILSKNPNIAKSKIYCEYGNSATQNLLDNTLKKIYKIAKMWKDEYSIDVLYLAFGFLKWFESKDSYEPKYAPLLFLPVELKNNANIWSIKIKNDGAFVNNESLVRKLDNDFNIDATFDNESDNLNLAYTEYCQKILSQCDDERWEIDNSVYLSNFDFSKIHIYKDIETNIEKIIDSDFFKNLMDLENDIDSSTNEINEANIDSKIDVFEQYKILDSDSSQEIAVQNAIRGKSFVLQGPPGTGKSQTITNIITELISRNKKILFVAEKNAALQVVYNNLRKIGLEKYAIPIHDSKVNKTHILQELAESIDKAKLFEIDEQKMANFAENYEKVKDILTNYGQVLLKKCEPEFESIYEYIGKYFYYKDAFDLHFVINNILDINNAKFTSILESIDRFFYAYKTIKFNYKDHKWYGFENFELDSFDKNELFAKLSELNNRSLQLRNYLSLNNILSNKSIIDINFTKKIKDINSLLELYKSIKPEYKNDALTISQIENNYQLINQLIDLINHKNDLVASLEVIWTNLLFANDQNIENVYEYVKKTHKKPFRFLSPKWNRQIKQIKKSLKNPKLLKNVDIVKHFEMFVDLSESNKKIENILNQLAFFIDTNDQNMINDSKDKLELLTHLYKKSIISNTLLSILANDEKKSKLSSEVVSFLDKFYYLVEILNKESDSYDYLDFIDFKNVVNILVNSRSELEEYLNFLTYKKELYDADLSSFVEAIFAKNITDNYKSIFLKRFYKQLIESILDSELQNSDAIFMNSNLELFRQRDKQISQIAKDRIIMHIDKNIKKSTAFQSANPQYNIIKREASKKRTRVSFKTIFEQALDFILKLKPCLMLSPLTVSHLFKDIDYKFDTVIFDEASQIKPETAISSLFRAKQVIIVGDKEQMPPSNFFSSIDNDDFAESNEIEQDVSSGYESLLKLADGNLNSIKLKWHYRSKYEDLITTSNNFIYKDLVTFPNSKSPSEYEGLHFEYAKPKETDYEQETIIKSLDILKKIITNYRNKYSVGIVVFNLEIEKRVNEELEKFKSSNPDLSFFFDDEVNEPFFVKNIETVQGDERDFIIFVINGKVNKNNRFGVLFGEINKENGYRRLNVAITRAKRGLIVVSNFKHSEVDWFRSDQPGIKMLEKFIKNAEFGINISESENEYSTSRFDSLFEKEVYDELTKRGWNVKRQIGYSDFKIDLAITEPYNENKFILGIECDGSSFNLSKTARDRDRLRQQIFESRGWIIHRIWSADWFKNPSHQINIIEEKLLQLTNIKPTNFPLAVTKEAIEDKIDQNAHFIVEKETDNVAVFDIYPSIDGLTESVVSSFLKDKNRFDHIKYYDLSNMLKIILSKLGPIPLSTAYKIAKNIKGDSMVTKTTKDTVDSIIWNIGNVDENGFIIPFGWKFKFRESNSLENKRSVMDIHDKEIEHFILTIFSLNNMPISVNDFARELTNKTFNKSLSAKQIAKVKNVLENLKRESIVAEESDGTYRLI